MTGAKLSRTGAAEETDRSNPRVDAVATRLTRAYLEWPVRRLKEEALFFGVSRSGSKAQLAARIVPFRPDYAKAEEASIAQVYAIGMNPIKWRLPVLFG